MKRKVRRTVERMEREQKPKIHYVFNERLRTNVEDGKVVNGMMKGSFLHLVMAKQCVEI